MDHRRLNASFICGADDLEKEGWRKGPCLGHSTPTKMGQAFGRAASHSIGKSENSFPAQVVRLYLIGKLISNIKMAKKNSLLSV